MKKLITAVLLLVLVASLFCGCQKQSGGTEATPTPAAAANTPGASTANNPPEEAAPSEQASKYPLFSETVPLTMWCPLQRTNLEYITTYADIVSLKWAMELLNVNITFSCPAFGQEQTEFSLLLASQDYPDMARQGETSSGYFINGAEKNIEDGVILDLNDVIDKYMPNYKKMRDYDESIRKNTLTDTGKTWAVYVLNYPMAELPYNGLVIRKDWLDDLNMPVPETLEEWDTSLTAFKENYHGGALWTPSTGTHWHSEFLSAWNIGNAFYNVNGEVRYGPIQPEYKEYLTMMHDWYSRGLIHRDFTSNLDPLRIDKALMASGETGASNTQIASACNRMVLNGEVDDPDFWLQPVVAPVMHKGDIQHFGLKNSRVRAGTCIFADTEHLEEVAKFIDFFYTQDGIMLVNYGIPELHYHFKDGADPDEVFNDLMYNPHSDEALRDVFANGRIIMNDAFYEEVPDSPFAINCLNFTFVGVNLIDNVLMVGAKGDRSADIRSALAGEQWSKAACDYEMPVGMSMTAEESSEYSAIFTDIQTLVDEFTAKAIVGLVSADEWDAFAAQVKSMNIDRCIALQQAALTRYNAR